MSDTNEETDDPARVTARVTLTAEEGVAVDDDAVAEALTDLVAPGTTVEAHTEVRDRGDPLPDEEQGPDGEGPAVTPTADPKARFEVYEDRAGEFRWRLVHDNGNVIADSGEGYATWRGAENGLRSVKRNAPDATVERL
jgi:uncharacterized protein YegP (UPF0339 family)